MAQRLKASGRGQTNEDQCLHKLSGDMVCVVVFAETRGAVVSVANLVANLGKGIGPSIANYIMNTHHGSRQVGHTTPFAQHTDTQNTEHTPKANPFTSSKKANVPSKARHCVKV